MTETAIPAEPVTAKTIWDVAAEPTEQQTTASSNLTSQTVWTAENTKPAPTTPAQPEQRKYSEAYYDLSGKNAAGMVTGTTTMAYGGLNHWLMKRRLHKIMTEEEFEALELKMKNTPDKVTDDEKKKLKQIEKIVDMEMKIRGEIEWTKEEEQVLAESFTEYQKFTGKPLPPWIMIAFCIAKKTLKITNAYIFA
jgi:hypothetical protein